MNVELGIAGIITVAVGLGHETLGLVWVLPGLTTERVPSTRLGPPAMTVSMLRVTWHIVTIFAVALGSLLMALALADAADPKTLLLRWFSVMWLAATAMVVWVARRRLRGFLRLPVPLLWVVDAVLLWKASS